MERQGSGIVVRSGGSIGVNACFQVPGGTGVLEQVGSDRSTNYWRDSAGVHLSQNGCFLMSCSVQFRNREDNDPFFGMK
jgi:hypothetical protein